MTAAAVKLSPTLKALIAAPHALGQAIAGPSKAKATALFDGIRGRGESGGVGAESWITLSAAALVTVNSPAALCGLFDYAVSRRTEVQDQVQVAATIRETALKCISFSGIPRTINALNTFHSHLPSQIKEGLATAPTRQITTSNLEATASRGRGLWDAIYEPHSVKLLKKLGEAHPDLPVHILSSHYGPLLSDPLQTPPTGHSKIGRILTSLVAIACLRSQQGVAPQLTSHVFGLKKSLLEGGGAEGEAVIQGQEWLTSDEGVTWVLESTDAVSDVVSEGRTTFAGPMRAKL